MPDPRSKGLRHYVGRNQSPTYQPLRCWRCWKQDNSVSHCKLKQPVEILIASGHEDITPAYVQRFDPVNLCLKCATEATKSGLEVEKLYPEEWEKLLAPESSTSQD